MTISPSPDVSTPLRCTDCCGKVSHSLCFFVAAPLISAEDRQPVIAQMFASIVVGPRIGYTS